MLFLQMNALVRPRISFHRAGAIKRLKNGGVTMPELKGENQFNQLFIILPGYTKIALVLSTLIKSPPVFFSPLGIFFSWKQHAQLTSEFLDSKMVAIKQEM